MKNKDKIKERILTEEDYVFSSRMGHSLSKLMDKYPNGLSDDKIQKALLLEDGELQTIYERAVEKLKNLLKL